MFYRLKDDGTILDCADFRYADDCLETDKNIVRAFTGLLVFEEETETKEYKTKKAEFEARIGKEALIEEKKARLEELRKDIVQSLAGLVISDIEARKEEYRTLLNEVRTLQGKEPREIEV